MGRKKRNAVGGRRRRQPQARPFSVDAFNKELEQGRPKPKKQANKQFHIVRKIIGTEGIIDYVEDVRDEEIEANCLIISYFRISSNTLTKTDSEILLKSIEGKEENQQPIEIKRHVFADKNKENPRALLGLGEYVREILKDDYQTMRVKSKATDPEIRLPHVSSSLGFTQLGRFKNKNDAFDYAKQMQEIVPGTLLVSTPEAMYIEPKPRR